MQYDYNLALKQDIYSIYSRALTIPVKRENLFISS